MPAVVVRRPVDDARTSSTGRGSTVRLLLSVAALGVMVAVGVAIWVSPRGADGNGTGAGVPAASATGTPAPPVRTSTAKGSHAGYDATVESARTDIGTTTLTTLDVFLSTEGEPASAPSAEAVLTGADGRDHSVRLTIIGAGHWTSDQFRIGPGHYRLTARFHRSGKPVIIPMAISLK